MNTESIFDKAYYYFELWLTYGNAIKWKDSKIQFRIKALPDLPTGFRFNEKKAGSQYAYVGFQEVSFNRSLNEIEQFPSRVIEELKNNWHPFLQSILRILK